MHALRNGLLLALALSATGCRKPPEPPLERPPEPQAPRQAEAEAGAVPTQARAMPALAARASGVRAGSGA